MTPSFLDRFLGRSKPPPGSSARLESHLGPQALRFTAHGAPPNWLDHLDAWPTGEHGRLLVLRQLVEQEVAKCTDSGLEVPYRDLRALPDEDLAALRVAEPWPHRIRLEEVGTLDMPAFRCRARFLDDLGRDVPGLQRFGCFFQQASRRWFLTREAFALLEALDVPPAEACIEDHLERFAQLRDLALRAGARLSSYLETEEVLAPDRLDLELVAAPDGALQVRLTAEGLADGRELREKLDGGPVLPRVLTFHRPGLRRIRMVAGSPVRQALEQVRPLRHLQGARKQDFLDRPERYLTSPAVDLEQFSERMRAAGIQRFRATPRRTSEGSLELRLESETGEESHVVPCDAPALEQLCREAAQRLEAGHLSFEFQGRRVRLEPSLLEDLEVVSRPRPTALPAPAPVARPKVEPIPPEPRPASARPVAGTPPPRAEGATDVPVPIPEPAPPEAPLPTPVQEAPLLGGVPCEPPVLPASLSPHVKLLLHQFHGVAWLQTLVRRELSRGALLADDMGLGKTLQVWTFLEWYREQHPGRGPVLLVVPVTLLDNWAEEYRTFFRGPGHLEDRHLYRLHGPGLEALRTRDGLDVPRLAEHPVVLTGYATVRNHYVDLGRIPWSVVVADETQTIKNPSAATTQALKHLPARFRVAMTGTPVENGLADLWSIMDFAVRGHLGARKEFLDTYNPGSEADYATLAARIAALASPSLLRRRKQDYLEGLPERHLHFVPLAMTERQRADYLRVVSEYRGSVSSGRKGLMDLLIRLRQVCCAAEGLEPGHSTQEAEEASCKVRWLLEKLRQIRERGEKALVFVEYRDLQRLLVSLLEREFGIPVGMINGDVEASGRAGSESPRRQILRRFSQTQGFSVLVLSPLAAGVGLTIVEANHVIHFTRHWNPAKEDQATDRVYRIGQTREVHVYHPLALGAGFKSLDERLHELLEGKRKLQQSALFPVASREVDVERLTGILDVPEDPGGPIRWEDVVGMDPATFRRFVCALHGRMGWQVTRLGGHPLDARGHRGEEVLKLRCLEPGEEGHDLPEGTILVRRHPGAGEALPTALGPTRLAELLEQHRPNWDDLLAYLPPEEVVTERGGHAPTQPTLPALPAGLAGLAEPTGPPPVPEAREKEPAVPEQVPVISEEVTPIPVPAPPQDSPPWLVHLPAALRRESGLEQTRTWLSQQLAAVPEAAARLPDVRRLLRLTPETLATATGRDPEALFRVCLNGEADAALLPDGRTWRLFLREGLAPQEEVRLFVHALAHRLLGHLRDGDAWGHWDRLGSLDRRRWDREAEALLQVDTPYGAQQELASLAAEAPRPVVLDRADSPALVARAVQASPLPFLEFLEDLPVLDPRVPFAPDLLPFEPWPHQVQVASEILAGFPCRRLLCDEVGLGKTIETGLALRELVHRGLVKRVLLLVPAGVQTQWREELLEKFNLRFAPMPDRDPWKGEFLLRLASSHLVRRRERAKELLEAEPWDLVIVDEAHHARKSPDGQPNRMLQLLRGLEGRTRGLLLLTATPLQLDLSEVEDLLALLGEPHSRLGRYYELLAGPLTPEHYRELRPLLEEFTARWGGMAEREKRLWERRTKSPPGMRAVRLLEGRPGAEAGLDGLAKSEQETLRLLLGRRTALQRRMFRNTRALLRKYRERGLIQDEIPTRRVTDVMVGLSPREQEVYQALEDHFRRVAEEARRLLGPQAVQVEFLLDLYRRRLTSSLHAIGRSLGRRTLRLARVLGLRRQDLDPRLVFLPIPWDEEGERDLEELDEDEALALEPEEPGAREAGEAQLARFELASLAELAGRVYELVSLGLDSKRERFLELLYQLLDHHEKVLVFTQFTDTMDDLREELRPRFREGAVGCFSGRGGEVWCSGAWVEATKEEIKTRFRTPRDLQVLLCTDAASEGLNFQTCGVLLNYDMPWNPMRVEQRIGRIDRIGQKHAVLEIRNLYYEESIEARVYERLRDRIGLFHEVVGPLQPILAGFAERLRGVARSAGPGREHLLEGAVEDLVRQSQATGAPPIDPDLDEPELFTPPKAPALVTPASLAAALRALPGVGEVLRDLGPFRVEALREGEAVPATFDPRSAEEGAGRLRLLAPGEPLFHELLSRARAQVSQEWPDRVKVARGRLGPAWTARWNVADLAEMGARVLDPVDGPTEAPRADEDWLRKLAEREGALQAALQEASATTAGLLLRELVLLELGRRAEGEVEGLPRCTLLDYVNQHQKLLNDDLLGWLYGIAGRRMQTLWLEAALFEQVVGARRGKALEGPLRAARRRATRFREEHCPPPPRVFDGEIRREGRP